MSTCWQLARAAFAVAMLSTCGHPLKLQGSPAPQREIDARGSTLALPRVGEARSDALVDGWPVWVIRHPDGSVTVLSAVAPPRARSAATLFVGAPPLVRWIPGSRRLLAGEVAYDEWGRVQGYAANDACDDDCPRIAEPAPEQRSLDRFDARLVAQRIVVGALRRAVAPPAVSAWVDWDHEDHVGREIDPRADELRPLAPVPIAGALARPIGSYALVTGSIVQSTIDTPHLCADTDRCAACDASSPRALGVVAVPVDKPADHAESGTILVRREALGLAVIAMSHYGACNTTYARWGM